MAAPTIAPDMPRKSLRPRPSWPRNASGSGGQAPQPSPRRPIATPSGHARPPRRFTRLTVPHVRCRAIHGSGLVRPAQLFEQNTQRRAHHGVGDHERRLQNSHCLILASRLRQQPRLGDRSLVEIPAAHGSSSIVDLQSHLSTKNKSECTNRSSFARPPQSGSSLPQPPALPLLLSDDGPASWVHRAGGSPGCPNTLPLPTPGETLPRVHSNPGGFWLHSGRGETHSLGQGFFAGFDL